ncbi:protein kinase 4 isoform X2 [Drosophila albomicans]|uniref:Fibroblast growth factor n=1 Tax=Drosophila albomicans TaxID=7291 RepID=A0A9C6WGR3_DROAB|nr:protein kinase 4 isoform X2 [Drosophila albomicans]
MRINQRLDWRALALLGALLSCIIAWPRLVFAMPALTTMSNQSINNTNTNIINSTYNNNTNNTNNINNNTYFSNLIDSNSSIQSDHSRSSPRVLKKRESEYSVNQNQSISAEFNMRTLTTPTNQLTAINTTTTTTTTQNPVTTPATNADRMESDALGFTFSVAHRDHFAILSRTERSIRHQQSHHKHQQHQQQQQQQSASVNAEPSRKIQIYIKNRFLQILPDGTVNGTTSDHSDYAILQRSAVDVGRIKIQSVATCLYLCMDACGVLYAWKDFTDDCVFNENMELQNYNTYSSTYNSNARRVSYLALNRHGQPRRMQIPASRSLGKLTTYTNAITEPVPQLRVDQLIAKNFGANRVKHGVRQLCDTGKPLIDLIDVAHFKPHPKCPANGISSSSSSSSSSSNSSSNSSNSSSNVPEPAASASSLISIPNRSQSFSGHISNSSNSNSSNNSNSNSSKSSNQQQPHKQKPKGKKLRKCRKHENEETHNCQKRPGPGAKAGALRKRGPKAQRCKDERDRAAATGAPPPKCGKKPGPGGPKRHGGTSAIVPGATKGAHQKPRGPMNQGGKKKQAGKQRSNPNGGAKKQRSPKRQFWSNSTTTTVRTTTTSTMASSLAVPGKNFWETSSPMPALALSETSDRVERNVRMPMTNNDEEELDEDEEESEEMPDSQEATSSYEDETQEGHGRSGAADESLDYDHFNFPKLLIIHLLSMLWMQRSFTLCD